MRVFANFSPTIRILLWAMFTISLVVAVLAMVIVCGVTLPVNISPAQAGIFLFSAGIVTVFSLLLATVHYRVTATHLQLRLAFFDILGGRIRLENILNIVKKDGKLYISYIWKGEDPVIAQIAISPKHFDTMKNALMQKNKNILYFDEDDEVE